MKMENDLGTEQWKILKTGFIGDVNVKHMMLGLLNGEQSEV